ncbi:MAG: PEGA domain-containing protein [Myxococcota bacterium]
MVRHVSLTLSLALSLLVARPAWSQSIADEADLLFQKGAEAYDRFEYEAALLSFMQSNRLSPNAVTAGNVGHTYVAMRKYPEAYRWYALADSLSEEGDTSIRASMDAIKNNVVLVNLTSTPAGATVYVDQKSLGAVATTPATIALPAGDYTFIISRDGYADYTSSKTAMKSLGKSFDIQGDLKPITGRLRVEGEDDVEVRLASEEGDVLCVSPCEEPIPIGQQIVYFRKEGYRSQPALLTVEEGKTVSAQPTLIEITGSLAVSATERGALVEIDGVAVGFTPTVAPAVRVGTHTIRISREGFATYEAEVEVVEGEQLDLGRIQLNPNFTVTAASKTAQDVSEAPASVTLIPAEEIRAFGYQSVYEAAAGVRGIYQTNDLTYQSLGIRGFGRVGDYGNRVLTTIDGHTTNDDQIGSSYIGTDFLSDLGDVKQIEVVRGPGSSLYGSNAVFGVVNVVMRDGTSDNTPHVSATATDGLLRGRASAGVGDEDVGAWLTVSGLYGLGRDYQFDEYADDPRTHGASVDNDKTTATTVSGKAWFGDLTIKTNYTGREKQIATGSFGSLLADPRARSNDFRGYVEAEYDHAFNNTRVDVRTYLDAYRFRGVFPYGREYLYRDFYDGAWFGIEPRVIQTIGDVADVTVGLDTAQHFLSNMVSEERETLDGEAFGTPLDEKPVFQTYSAYAVADIHPGEVFRVNVGGRLDQFNNTVESFTTFNPRAAIILTPGKEVVKFFGGTAFRAPSPYEYFYTDGGISTVPPDEIDPETVLTVEAEWTHQFDEVLSFTVAGYFNRINNLVDSETVGDTDVFRFANVDDPVTSVGGEAEVRRTWRGGWMLSGQTSVQRTRVEGIEGSFTNSPTLLASAMGAVPLGSGVTLAQKIRTESPRLTNGGDMTPWAAIWDVTLTGQLAEPNLRYGIGVRNLLDWRIEHPGGPDVRQDVFVQRGRDLFATVTLGF